MDFHTEAYGQKRPHKWRLLKSDKNNNGRHIGAAEPFEVDPPDIAFQVTARRIAVVVIHHQSDTD